MTKDFWQLKIQESEGRLVTLIEQMERSSPALRGDLLNMIDCEETNLKFYRQREISSFSETTSGQIRVFCYIIVTTKGKINLNLNEECLSLLEDDRYHDTDSHYWKPFYEENNIFQILEEIKKHFPFETIFLDCDFDNEHSVNIDENSHNSIGIIDLLSIDNENRDLVKCFDNERVAGVIIPKCRNITK